MWVVLNFRPAWRARRSYFWSLSTVSWKVRGLRLVNIFRYGLLSWIRWAEQRPPGNRPVIVEPGRLVADRDGKGRVKGFHFDTTRMTSPCSVDDLWDYLSALYPVERTHDLDA